MRRCPSRRPASRRWAPSPSASTGASRAGWARPATSAPSCAAPGRSCAAPIATATASTTCSWRAPSPSRTAPSPSARRATRARSRGGFEGIFLGPELALARWSSRTNTRTFPIYLKGAGRYAAVTLEGGARVVADDILALSHCSGQDNGVFPRVVDLVPPAAEATLNGALRDAAREHLVSVADCEAARDEGVAPWTDLGYAVTPTRKGGFALQLDWFIKRGGATGAHGRTCVVADMARGTLVDLRTLLTAEGRQKLGSLLAAATLKFYDAADLARVPLAAEEVEVNRAAVCATPGGLLLQLEPRPAGPGHNWDHVEVELTAREARPLFEANPITDALFEERGG